MIKIHTYLLILTALVLLNSCTRDDYSEVYREGSSKIFLSIGREEQVQVRGSSDDSQCVISDVHFLLFDGTTCIKHVYVADGSSTQIEIYNGTYTCYAVTNTGQNDLFSEATTIADLEEAFSFVLPRKDYWESNPRPAFVMGGNKEITISNSGQTHEIPVYRIASRIDMVITVNIEDAEIGKYNFTFKEIALEGFPMKATYCPNNGIPPQSGDISFRDISFTEDAGVVRLSFYMLENPAGNRLSEGEVSAAMTEQYPQPYDNNDPAGKRKYAPANAAHLLIKGHASTGYGDAISTTHYIYFGHNAANDYNVRRNEHHTYTVNINGVSELDVDTRVEVTVEQPEFSDLDPSNSYMIHNSGNYYIPATFMGNKKEKPLTEILGNIDESTLTAEFLWTDNKESIWLETIEYADDPNDPNQKIIKFRVRGNPQMNVEDRGNTIIALYGYDKEDVNKETPIILWTWHLWLTDQPKEVVIGGKVDGTLQNDIVYPGSNGTLIVMDRNLGATSANPNEGGVWRTYGCHYQMGRKDPFPNAKKDGEWFNWNNSKDYDQKSIGQSNEVINHLKFNETAPFAEFNADSRCAFNEKLAPDKVIGFKYVQEGISGLYAARNPMVFATKFQAGDTRWTDKKINDAINDPLYNITGARQDYWNREKTVHDPCPSGWTILGDGASFWNQGTVPDQFSYGGFKDANGKYIGGVYSQLPGEDKVWWPASGVRSIYGQLANLGHSAVYYMLDHIDNAHGAHIARFLLNTEINETNVSQTFTVQEKEPSDSGTYNGLLSQINVNGGKYGTNQAAVVRCVKVDQDTSKLNKN